MEEKCNKRELFKSIALLYLSVLKKTWDTYWKYFPGKKQYVVYIVKLYRKK